MRTSTGLPSAWSIALLSRFRITRSTRRISPLINTESRGRFKLISIPFSLATNERSAIQRSSEPQISNSTTSRTATSASKRLISSRSSSNRSKRSICPINNSELRTITGSNPSRALWITSDAMRSVVNGVRNSCETSETNRCCTRDKFSSRAICFSSDSAIALKAFPRLAISSLLLTCMRWLKSPSVNCCEIRTASRTGFTTCRTTIQIISPIRIINASPVR